LFFTVLAAGLSLLCQEVHCEIGRVGPFFFYSGLLDDHLGYIISHFYKYVNPRLAIIENPREGKGKHSQGKGKGRNTALGRGEEEEQWRGKGGMNMFAQARKGKREGEGH
tara:strand:+ start:130 stop:459 length:330 start_codon:yes stop_codon:yes gene_type:complete